jgi:ABC-type antimicrobial peptide transport system permease subunit
MLGVIFSFAVELATGLRFHLMSVGTTLFSYQPSIAASFTGIAAAAVIGTLGGLLPAWRAAQTNIVDSIGEV